MSLGTLARSALLSGIAGAFAVSGCSGSEDPGGAVATSAAAISAMADVVFTNPLRLPSVLSGSTAYNLTIESGTAQMKPGNATPVVGFNGTFPGPTIVATRGQTITVTQKNAWSENVSIHNHGHKVAASSDGHPVDYITPGASKVYTYTNDQPAGTFWYHDHTMDVTGSHVYHGLAGFYIIHDPAEDSLGLPSGDYDVPLLLQDKSFDTNNGLTFTDNGPFFGDTPVVNGTANPVLDVANRKYRFRLLNGSNVRPWSLSLTAGTAASFQVIGSDGGLLTAPVSVTSLSMYPAERYDIVVDFSKYPVGTTLSLSNADTTAPAIKTLMQFRVSGTETDTSTVPSALATITRLEEADAKAKANITLSTAGGVWELDGLTYDPSRIDLTSTTGAVTIWTLTNNSPLTHPFHKHLTEFNILDVNGQAPSAAQNGLKDTVQVPANGTARIIFKNETFTGTYVFHCHLLDHEDNRMMLQEGVTQ